MAFNKAAQQALGYTGSKNGFANAGAMFELPEGRKYAKNPFGSGSMGTPSNDVFARAQQEAVKQAAYQATHKPGQVTATPQPQMLAAHTPGQVTATPTQPDLNAQVEALRKPVNWAKVSGVPVIDKPQVTEISPVITEAEAEASRLKNVAIQDANHEEVMRNAQQGALQDSIAAAQAEDTMLNSQAVGARTMIQQGTIGGMIQGQMMLDSIAKQKAANAGVTGATLGAQVNAQKNLVDMATQGKVGQAQLLNAQSEQAFIQPKISLMAAQAALAGKQGELTSSQSNLAAVQAKYYPDTITAKNQQYADEQANKNVEIQQKMMSDVMKASEMEILANPGQRDAILQKNIKAYLKNLPK